MSVNKDAEKKVYFDWLDMTANQRDEKGLPKSAKELASFLGVNTVTLSNWSKSKREVIEPEEDEDKDFGDHLRELAMRANPSGKHVELYMRYKGLFIEKKEVKLEVGLSAEERFTRYYELQREVSKQLNRGGEGEGTVAVRVESS